MRRTFVFLSLLMMLLVMPASLVAEDQALAARNYATVRLFFVNQYLPETQSDRLGGGAGGLGAGGMLMFETADLYLDDKLVSNVMFRHVEVRPSLNLPSGDHLFRIECEGYRPYEKALTVLGNGSVQWLVVRLQREPKAEVRGDEDPVNR